MVSALNEDEKPGYSRRGTGQAVSVKSEFLSQVAAGNLSLGHVVRLGQHSNPIFLFKQILTELREELQFKTQIVSRARAMIDKIGQGGGDGQVVYVGVHARRGDRLQVWKSEHDQLQDSMIGRYEGRFFN